MTRLLEISLRSDRPNSPAPTRRQRSWPGVSVESVRIGSGAYDFAWRGSRHYLALHDIRRTDGETIVGGIRSHAKDLRGKITFVSSDTEVRGWTAPASRNNDFTAVYLEPQAIPDELVRLGPLLESNLYFQDQVLASTIEKLGTLVEGYTPDSAYAETLGLLLWMELGRSRQMQPHAPPHGLSSKAEIGVRDYIEAHLSSDITLSELAQVANLSRFHFVRSFKKSTGRSPYQYVLMKRIERARELIGLGTLPLEEVAATVGFPSEASLGRAFRRMTGITVTRFAKL
jgi:AraC family transcriptional regulator